MISTTVTVSKIVINSNGNIIPRLSQDENAAQVHSEALQVAISTKLKVRDRIFFYFCTNTMINFM